MAPRLVEGQPVSWLGVFKAERCGAPAVYIDLLGRKLCEACALRAKKAHEDRATVLSLLRPGPFALRTIQ